MAAMPSRLSQLRRLLGSVRPDGCIVHCGLRGCKFAEDDFGGLPVVWMDRDPAELGATALCVVQDSSRAGRVAARELLRYGDLRTFAFIDRADPQFWSGERRGAFREEVEAAGKAYVEFGDQEIRGRRRRLETFLLSLDRPAGVFCATDEVAGEVLESCARLGMSVPGGVAVVGVDNTAIFCEMQSPTLTSVSISFTSAGRAAAQLLQMKLADPEMPGAVERFGADGIVRRQSTRRVEVRGAGFNKGMELIRRAAAAGIGVDDVAAAMGCSRRSAEMQFRKWTGNTPLHAIHAERVALAKRLIIDELARPGDLPQRCGFKSAATFRRVFTEIAGMSPMAYMKSARAVPNNL
jgi:LacI family transcriptional regulator